MSFAWVARSEFACYISRSAGEVRVTPRGCTARLMSLACYTSPTNSCPSGLDLAYEQRVEPRWLWDKPL